MEVRRELTVESNVNMDEETKKMYDLAHYAGINFDPNLFKHIVDLLKEDVHPDAILKVLNDSCQKSPYGDPIKQEKIKRKSAAASALGHPVRRTSPSRARRCASHLRENNENIRFEFLSGQ